MSRIRTIKPEFWKHERLSEMPEATHMLAAALLNYADDDGYFNANPKLIAAECCPLREPSVSVTESLQLLAADGFLRVGQAADGKRYGHIIHFGDHQKINHPTASKIKALDIVWEYSSNPTVAVHEVSPLKGREGNREEERGNARGASKEIIQNAFEEFSAAYPKRQGSDPTEPARAKFERAIRDGADPDAVVRGARGYAAEQSKLGNVGTQFIKQRKAWLNDKSWLDYQPQAINGQAATPQVWITDDDPRWTPAAEQWRKSRGKPPFPMSGSHGNPGRGWYFPADLVSTVASVGGT